MISLSLQKSADTENKKKERTHGIFSYYLCKFIYDQPNVTVKHLSERMSFNSTFISFQMKYLV